ncbi:hypothetical protein GCM10027174_40980 [Salinifilum aidingensis]
MPIRTHRGRAAVYRRLWGWPLRSPRHLAIAVLVVAVVGTGVGLLLPEPPPSPSSSAERSAQRRAEVPAPSPEEDLASKSPPSLSVPTRSPRPAPADPAGVDAVRSWGKRWVDYRGGDQAQWLDGLRPYTTDEFITVMESVNPANAGNAITGAPKPMESTRTSMVVRLPTDVGVLRVTAVRTQDGWRVANYTGEG